MKWTEQQKKAIEAEGRDILVSAAAGSGKTAVLTERIKRLIIEKNISVENMLIVTFSNAAAAEMKEKVIKALKKAADEDHTQAARLRAQIRRARTADISTFHKFSMGVIRRYFYLTDTDQNFGICDEGRRAVLMEEALDELIEGRFEGKDGAAKAAAAGMRAAAEGAADQTGTAAPESDGAANRTANEGGMKFTDFLRMYADVRSEDSVRDMIRDVYRFIMSMPDPFEWLSSAVEALNGDADAFRRSAAYGAMRGETVKALERACSIYERVCMEVSDLPSIAPKADADMEMLLKAAEAAASGTDDELKAALDIKFQTFRAGKADKELYSERKALIASQRDAVKKIIKSLLSEQFALSLAESVQRMRDTYEPAKYLEGMVKEFHERFTAKKRERNMLDFNDIEHEALSILRYDEIAAEYRQHFEVIFIDEYQDSSVLQETLIQQISRGDNVYMVGDVKQSIYKFRLAEPEIFIDKYNDFRDGTRPGERIDLNRNFRSKGNIVRSVNAVFSNIMNRDTCGIDYDDDAALKKGSDYEGKLDKVTSLHLINTDKPDGDAPGSGGTDTIEQEILELKKTELEARVVAETAASRVGTEIYDQKSGNVRKAGPDDIVILLRGVRGQSDIYANALRDVGLPAYADTGEGYFETTEIEVFMNLLRIIDNRRSDIPLLSVLYSPIFGMTTDDLIRIRMFDRSVPYHEAFLALADAARADDAGMSDETRRLAARCRDVCGDLDRWRGYARYMQLERLLWKLMQETGYLDYASALPGGDRRAANLRSLVDKAVDFSSSRSKGLFAFLQYIEAVNSGQTRTGQALQPDSGEKMIRIMTIHKSKGLEFPVVILAGLGRRFNYDRNPGRVVMHRKYGIGLMYSDPGRHCRAETLIQRIIAAQKKRESMAEEMRILYVAMTRPMDELILTGAMRDVDAQLERYYTGTRGGAGDALCYLDWIVPYYKAGGMELYTYDRQMLAGAAAAAEESKAALLDEMKSGFPSFKDTDGLAARFARRFDYKYPYADDVASKSKFSVTELNKALRGDVFAPSGGVRLAAADEDGAFAAGPHDEEPAADGAGRDIHRAGLHEDRHGRRNAGAARHTDT